MNLGRVSVLVGQETEQMTDQVITGACVRDPMVMKAKASRN